MHRRSSPLFPYVRVAIPGRIDAISDAEKNDRARGMQQSQPQPPQAYSGCESSFLEGKARTTAEGVLFRPLASAVAPYMPAQGGSEELGCPARLLSSVELFYQPVYIPATKTSGRH